MEHAFIAVMAFLAGLTAGAQTYTYLGGNSDAGIFASVNSSGASADLAAYWQDGLVPFDSVTNAELGVGADIVLGGATLAQYKNYRMASALSRGGDALFSFDAALHSTSLFYCGEDAAELLNKLEGNDD